MNSAFEKKPFSPFILLALAFLSFVVLLSLMRAGAVWYQMLVGDESILFLKPGTTLGFVFLLDLLTWLPVVLLSPAVFWLLRRFPVIGNHWYRSLTLHFLFSIPFALVNATLYLLFSWSVGITPASRLTMLSILASMVGIRMLSYWLVFIVGLFYEYYKKYQDRELRASQLETELARANLHVLKMQLHPHFLFNTLNAISALVHRNPETADRMISRLSDMLRQTLETSDLLELPLKEELHTLLPYLDIEKMRLGTKLEVSLRIAPETEYALVPNFLLQPLVENSIRHGIVRRPEGGRVDVEVVRNGRILVLVVSDTGVGFSEALESILNKGMGLSRAVQRLEKLYGRESTITIQSEPERGTKIVIEIPYKTLNDDQLYEH